jgi:DNA-binding NarL/FixJ family response regulator
MKRSLESCSSVSTVRAHLQALFEKFGVVSLSPDRRRTRLIELARHTGLLSDDD